jgi:glycosyltransferase involved in cell wall biosynthesis
MVAYAQYFTDARIKNYVDALVERGMFVDVIALGKRKEILSEGNLWINNVDVKYDGIRSSGYILAQMVFLLKALWVLLKRSLTARYDVIHTHNMPDVIALTGAPFRLLGSKIILDIHDTMPEAYATKYNVALDSPMVKLLVMEELFSAACANKIIATNALHKEVLVKHGILEHKIALILNVGNRKIFTPRERTNNKQDDLLWLGYHGTIARRLGLFLIIEALALLKENCPRLRFLCIGEGEDLAEMQEYAEQKGVTQLIKWQPFIEVEKLPDALKDVDVGIIGNRHDTEVKKNYMLPVKMLEYAAMEIPTIAPRLKAIECYFDETSAFYYQPDDPHDLASVIRSIYQDPSLIKTRIDGVRKFNNAYNWEIMEDRYRQIINELTAG